MSGKNWNKPTRYIIFREYLLVPYLNKYSKKRNTFPGEPIGDFWDFEILALDNIT